MICNNCGNDMADVAKFCTKCGTPITQQNQKIDNRPAKPYISGTSNKPIINPSKNTNSVIKRNFEWKEQYTYVVIVIAIVLAATIGFTVKAHKSAEKTAISPVANGLSYENGKENKQVEQNVSQTEEFTLEENVANQEYILTGSDIRFLDKIELQGFSAEECRFARNELYARHGRMFDDERLQAYFDQKKWYNGSLKPSDFTEDMLNEYEIHNRDLIVEYEKEMGYR